MKDEQSNQAAELNADHGDMDPSFGAGVGGFVIAHESPLAHQPAKSNGGRPQGLGRVYEYQKFASAEGTLQSANMNYRNLRVNGGFSLSASNGERAGVRCRIQRNADSFRQDLHPDLKGDFILANPPFNMSDWVGESLLRDFRGAEHHVRLAALLPKKFAPASVFLKRHAEKYPAWEGVARL